MAKQEEECNRREDGKQMIDTQDKPVKCDEYGRYGVHKNMDGVWRRDSVPENMDTDLKPYVLGFTLETTCNRLFELHAEIPGLVAPDMSLTMSLFDDADAGMYIGKVIRFQEDFYVVKGIIRIKRQELVDQISYVVERIIEVRIKGIKAVSPNWDTQFKRYKITRRLPNQTSGSAKENEKAD